MTILARKVRIENRRKRPVDYSKISINQIRIWNYEYSTLFEIDEEKRKQYDLERYFIIIEKVEQFYPDQSEEEDEYKIKLLHNDRVQTIPAHTILTFSDEVSNGESKSD